MTDLNEQALLECLHSVRKVCIKPAYVRVTDAGLATIKEHCAEDPEFRRVVLAQFPQLEGVI